VAAQFCFGSCSYRGSIPRTLGVFDCPHSAVAEILQLFLATEDSPADFAAAAGGIVISV
jgi:hypothetical protein